MTSDMVKDILARVIIGTLLVCVGGAVLLGIAISIGWVGALGVIAAIGAVLWAMERVL
jgi:ABC-type antimicrobial peptide transport system permease subunit